MYGNLVQQLQTIGDLAVETDVPMSEHTSFGIGGPADVFVTPHSVQALAAALRVTREHGERPLVIGKGTNMLVLDGGIRGAVIRLAGGMETLEVDGRQITADSGVGLASLCRACAAEGLAGMEWAAGIPGTVGGAIHMNAGAHGGEIRQFTQWVTVATFEGDVVTYPREEIHFGYRTSSFQGMDVVIARACLTLEESSPAEVHKAMCGVLETRCSKQPVAMPSAGCIFKRPQNDYAGRLLEEVGAKGVRVGGAVVSPKHANFIVNVGAATARDVLELVALVKAKVYDTFGVELQTEVCVVGEPLPGQQMPAEHLVSEHAG